MRDAEQRSFCTGPRLAVATLTFCSAALTLNARRTVVTASTYAAIKRGQMAQQESFSVHQGSYHTEVSLSSPLRPPPPPPAQLLKSDTILSGPPPPPTKSTGRFATKDELGRGWRRTLPEGIAAKAVWFDHERTLREIFDDVPVGGVVWLTFANSAFQDFAINWAAHLYRLRKERAMAIAALDQPFQRRLLSEGLPYFGYDHGRTGDLRSSVTEFRRLGALKGALVLAVLRAERHVLLSDVDVIWMDDPTRVLASLAVHADVMSATDCLTIAGDEAKLPPKFNGVNRCAYNPGNGEGHAAFNTGVTYFRPSREAKAFAAAWRNRLLSVEKSAWLDDQLAFNELVWHGFRNHPQRSVHAASADGKVIWVRMGKGVEGEEAPTPPAASKPSVEGQASGYDLKAMARPPELQPTPAWRDGWRDLLQSPHEAFHLSGDTLGARGGNLSAADASRAIGPIPMAYRLAPLPARHFCSGHLFWEQQALRPLDCFSVHTTFVEGGNAGKLWRFREAGLWLLDPPEHFAPAVTAGGRAAEEEEEPRYLTFEPPHPPASGALWPLINRTRCPSDATRHAPCPYTDKYKAGWLVPDALAMSPRLRQHLELVRRHLLALRDALALAYATKRVLVLPRLPCLCDRSEGPLVLRECKYEASELPTPFVCPLTHIVDIVRFASISPDMATSHMPFMGRRGIASVRFRESSFLTNPLTPEHVRTNVTSVRIVSDAAAMRRAQANGEVALLRGSSDAQARAALGGGTPFVRGLMRGAEARVLRLESAEGIFGGFVEPSARGEFEAMIAQSSLPYGSWCCSSWYKPSGSIEYVAPTPTLMLERGCGTASPLEGGGGAAAAGQTDAKLAETCAERQAARERMDRGPALLEYRLKAGREGRDGYYEHAHKLSL